MTNTSRRSEYPEKLLLWPDMVSQLSEPLAWLVQNQRAIVNSSKGCRPMSKNRPVVYYPRSNKVRVEFVGTFDSPEEAAKLLSKRIESNKEQNQ